MIEYIVAHKEIFFVLGVMAFLGILMFFLSGMARKDAAKTRNANTENRGESAENK